MIGQFIQLDENRGDAGNIESQNRYAYALNNPNKYIDKNGRAARLMCDGGSSGGIGGLIGAAGKLVKDIATKSPKKNQSTSQMTSQDRYNLWMGHDSWDNYGGKPKGVYATQADYNKAHPVKPSGSNTSKVEAKPQPCDIQIKKSFDKFESVDCDFTFWGPTMGDGLGSIKYFAKCTLYFYAKIDQYDTFEKIYVEVAAILYYTANKVETSFQERMTPTTINDIEYPNIANKQNIKQSFILREGASLLYSVYDCSKKFSLNTTYKITSGILVNGVWGVADGGFLRNPGGANKTVIFS